MTGPREFPRACDAAATCGRVAAGGPGRRSRQRPPEGDGGGLRGRERHDPRPRARRRELPRGGVLPAARPPGQPRSAAGSAHPAEPRGVRPRLARRLRPGARAAGARRQAHRECAGGGPRAAPAERPGLRPGRGRRAV